MSDYKNYDYQTCCNVNTNITKCIKDVNVSLKAPYPEQLLDQVSQNVLKSTSIMS